MSRLASDDTLADTSISSSKKAGGRLALSLYVLLHNASAGLGVRLGARAPTPHEEAAVSVLKKISRIYMYGNGLVVFGVFWGISRP